jgi:hypothetical protein
MSSRKTSIISTTENVANYEAIDRTPTSSTQMEKFKVIEKRLVRKIDLR